MARKKAESLANAFNEASGLFKALEALKNRPHSTFTYEVWENSKEFQVTTNIPVLYASYNYNSFGDLKLTVNKASKETIVDLGSREKGWGSVGEELRSGKDGDVTKIIKVITRRAAENGLVV